MAQRAKRSWTLRGKARLWRSSKWEIEMLFETLWPLKSASKIHCEVSHVFILTNLLWSFIHLGQATSRSNIKSQWKLQGLEGFHEVELDLLSADMNWITYSDYSAQKFRIQMILIQMQMIFLRHKTDQSETQRSAKLIEAMWLLCTVCHYRWHCSCKQLSFDPSIKSIN